jgi:hypothetical protein
MVLSTSAQALTITASAFNSGTLPFTLTETTTIILDEDIVFTDSGLYAPIITSGSFTADDMLIFTATDGFQVFINTDTIWQYNFNIEFQGNAQLMMAPGSGLYANNFSITIGADALFNTVNEGRSR